MDTTALKKFAQAARRQLLAQVEARLAQVLHTDSPALREKLGVINELRQQIEAKGKQNVIEEVAYTWFNRLCALRYMDVNHYTRAGVVSPAEGFSQPEILQNAKQGIFDPAWQLDQARVQGLLSGRISALNADQEAYRLLLVAVCNSYARQMNFLFEAIEDYSELLMPEDLLSSESVLAAVRDALTPESCQDVEVIGWLYQFYISEKKDQVMSAKGAVKKEDIPAVTQLFTPDWIVRYMVQNSLGRLWLLNHPASTIRSQMEYYIPPSEAESEYLKVSSPEELKVLDPACGSGHILTYAFDLLYAIYEEAGYDPLSIPQLILQKNLYGIEIDKRAAMLASFALLMKALRMDKRFLRRGVQPHILEMEDIHFTPQELKAYMEKVGQDLWTQDVCQGLQQFENAKTFGSLIRPVIKDVTFLRTHLQKAGVFQDLFLSHTNEKVLKVLEMVEYLSPRYQVVVANPPYFSKGMDAEYKQFAQEYYPDFKSDAFAMFVKRNADLTVSGGQLGFMTPFVWMFISSYEQLRAFMIDEMAITTLIQLEYGGFEGAVVPICTFTLQNSRMPDFKGAYIRLSDFKGADNQAPKTREAIENPDCSWFYRASAQDFKKIPGAPIAYWVSENVFSTFSENRQIDNYFDFQIGMVTGNNDLYVRFWYEVKFKDINFDAKSRDEAKTSKMKWFPYSRGGDFRKWFGNRSEVINWENDGYKIRNTLDPTGKRIWAHNFNLDKIFKPSLSWNSITSGKNSFRYITSGSLFDSAGGLCQPIGNNDLFSALGFLNSIIANYIFPIVNPTLNNPPGYLGRLPFIQSDNSLIVQKIVKISKSDWDAQETSWDFSITSLLNQNSQSNSLRISERFSNLRLLWQSIIDEVEKLENENNTILISAYGLQDVLSSRVPLEEISLNCNPHYRYQGNNSEAELEARLLEDTMKEFLSYAVGCMFGRYSLDKPGLILANQGESLEDYLRVVGKEPSFTPSASNVLPILDGEWFGDDIVARAKQFLRTTFGEQHYAENLAFIEKALGKDLRKYFLKDFYKDLVQMYKKRPIYWLFSSPKGGFNALVYMHRYRPDTVSVVLNQYLRPYRDKLSAQRRLLDSSSANTSASQRERSQALKEMEALNKLLAELKQYEDGVLYPLAAQKIDIDLDDGVKVNYAKFGEALRNI